MCNIKGYDIYRCYGFRYIWWYNRNVWTNKQYISRDLSNSIIKQTGYSSNYTDKVSIYSSNYSDLVSVYSSNYTDRVSVYSSNYTDLQVKYTSFMLRLQVMFWLDAYNN